MDTHFSFPFVYLCWPAYFDVSLGECWQMTFLNQHISIKLHLGFGSTTFFWFSFFQLCVWRRGPFLRSPGTIFLIPDCTMSQTLSIQAITVTECSLPAVSSALALASRGSSTLSVSNHHIMISDNTYDVLILLALGHQALAGAV